jgi:glycosyltransferase involved in cell wall biosynthesis
MILLETSFLAEKSTGIYTVIKNIVRVLDDNKIDYKTISYYDSFKRKNKLFWIIYYNIIVNVKLISLGNNDIFFMPANLGGMYFIFKAKAKIILLIYDIFEISECKKPIKKHINKLRFLSILKNADRIITISKYSLSNIVDSFPNVTKKIFCLYLFVECTSIKIINDEKFKDKITNIGTYILANGSGQERKNVQFIIKSMKSLYQKYGYKLILIGKDFYNNQYKEVLSAIAEYDCMDIIYHFGEVSNEELSFLYKNAFCFIFPSLNEGFGLPPLEALASNCKILVSDIPIFREIFYEMGCFFDFTFFSFENAFEKLLSMNNAQFLERRNIILESFTYEKYSNELIKVLAI